MTLNYQRANDTKNSQNRCNYLTTQSKIRYLDEQARSYTYSVHSSAPGQALVKSPSGENHVVDMQSKKCTCGMFQELLSPCRHAIRVCNEQRLDPYAYVDYCWTLEAYRSQYSVALSPIRMEDIPDVEPGSSRCLPPRQSNAKAGRRRELRFRKGKAAASNQQAVTCFQCGDNTHDEFHCYAAHG